MLTAPIAILLLMSSRQTLSQDKGPDKVKSSHVIYGKVVGFEVGDFEHVIIRGPGKHEDSYFIHAYLLDDFMALYAKKQGRFTIRSVDTYIEQAGGRQLVDQVSDAKIGKVSFSAWSKGLRKHMSIEQIDTKYRPLVDKLTKQ